MIFESHAHYDDEAFEQDRDQVLSRLAAAGVDTVINVAADLKGCENTVALMKQYEFIYGAVGVHPDAVGELKASHLPWLLELAKEEKVVAIGEIGLDYHWKTETPEVQQYWFREQLKLAKETKLPVIIHSRDAANDTLEMMKEAAKEGIGGVIHCFSYSSEMAKQFVSLGYYLGIGGVVTFKNAKKVKETVLETPIERILLETDCPYLAPEPNRGKRNDSSYLTYVVEEIARIKGLSCQEVIDITSENAKTLFNKVRK